MHSATPDAGELFLRAEQAGLKLAIIGRIGALVLMGMWLIGTRADDPTRALGYVLVLSIFATLGLAHYLSATTAGAARGEARRRRRHRRARPRRAGDLILDTGRTRLSMLRLCLRAARRAFPRFDHP